ncbi:adhesin domain-containing protein [Pseudoscourfieldia marina]
MGWGYHASTLYARMFAPRTVDSLAGRDREATAEAATPAQRQPLSDAENATASVAVCEADAGALSLQDMADAHTASYNGHPAGGVAAHAPLPVARAAPPGVGPPTTPPPRGAGHYSYGASPDPFGGSGSSANNAHLRKLQSKLTCERIMLIVLLMLAHDLLIGFTTILISRQENWWGWAGDDDDGQFSVGALPSTSVVTDSGSKQVILGPAGSTGSGSAPSTGGGTMTPAPTTSTNDGGVAIVDQTGTPRVSVTSAGSVTISSQGTQAVAINSGGPFGVASKSVAMTQGGVPRFGIADTGAMTMRGDGINLDASIASPAASGRRRALLQSGQLQDGRLSLSGKGTSLTATDILLGMNATSAGRMRLEAATSVNIDAGSAVAITAKTTASMASERASLTLSPTGEAYLVSSTGSVKLDSAQDATISSRKGLNVLATSDATMRSGGSFAMQADGPAGASLKATTGTALLQGRVASIKGDESLDVSSAKVTVTSTGTLGMTCSSQATLSAGTGIDITSKSGPAKLFTESGQAALHTGFGTSTVSSANGKVLLSASRTGNDATLGAIELVAAGKISALAGTEGISATSQGGVSVTASSGVAVSATAGSANVDISSLGGGINLSSQGSSGVTVAASKGPFNVAGTAASGVTVTADSDDDSLTVGVTGPNHKASLFLASTGKSDSAVSISASDAAGGVLVAAGNKITAVAPTLSMSASKGNAVIGATQDSVTTNGGQVLLTANRAANNAIDLHANALLGGIHLRSGLGGLLADTTGSFNVRSTGSSSSVTVVANSNDDTLRVATLGSTLTGKLVLEGQGIGRDATQLLASSTTGGVQIYAGVTYTSSSQPVLGGRKQRRNLQQNILSGQGHIDMKSGSGGILMETAGSFNLLGKSLPSKIALAADTAGDDLTVEVTGTVDASLVLKSSGLGIDAVQLYATAATGGIRMSSGTGGARIDTTGLIVLSTTANSALIESGLGKVQLKGGYAGPEAIGLATTNAAGGIALASGTSGISMTTSGSLVSHTTGRTNLTSGVDGTNLDSDGIIDIGSTREHPGSTRTINMGVVGGPKKINIGNSHKNTKVNIDGEKIEVDAEHGIVVDAGRRLELVGSRGVELDARAHRVEVGAGAASAVEVGTGNAVYDVEIGNKQVTKGSFYGLDLEIAATSNIEIAANDGIDIKCPGCDVDIKSTANIAGLTGGIKTMVNNAVSVFDYRLSPFTIYYGTHLGQASTVQVINVNEGALFFITRWSGSGSLTWKCGDDSTGVTFAAGVTGVIVCVDSGHRALILAHNL